MKDILKFFWQGVVQGFWEGVADAIAIFCIVLPVIGIVLCSFLFAITALNFIIPNTDYSLVSWTKFIGLEILFLLGWFMFQRMGNYTFNNGVRHFKDTWGKRHG